MTTPMLGAPSTSPDAEDKITILVAKKRMVKLWHRDGSISGYDNAKNYRVETATVSSIHSLSQLLTKLEARPNACIVRGRFVGWEEARKREALEHANKTFRRDALFDDYPLHTVLIEVDDFEPVLADPIIDPRSAIEEYITTCLPLEFQCISYHWQLSNSAGHPSKGRLLKVHLWFWLRNPYTSTQLKSWAGAIGLKADHSVFQKIQCHYTGAPIFEAGVTGPVPVRSGFVRGLIDDEVDLDIAPKSSEADLSERPARAESLKQAVHNDPTAQYLIDHGYVLSEGNDAKLNIRCPFEDEHSEESSESSTIYFAAHTGGYIRGHFKCMHAHCGDRQDRDFLEKIGAVAAGLTSLTFSETVTDLRKQTKEQILANWTTYAVTLSPDAAQTLVEEVHGLTGIKIRALKAALEDARKEQRLKQNHKEIMLRAGSRELIEYKPEDKTQLAHQVEGLIVRASSPGEYVTFGGLLASVVLKPLPYTHLIDDDEGAPPAVPQIESLDTVAALARIERVVAFFQWDVGKRRLIAVPQSIVEILVKKSQHAAPRVSGLVTHPLVLPDGSILAKDGLHAATGLFLSGASVNGACGYTQEEAAIAVKRIKESAFEGFEFASELDADLAVAGLLTGIERRVLDTAPGLAVVAAMQSSGKTSLLRIIHIVLTGRDMPVSTFPENDEAEVQKRLLAMLLRSPAMVSFDNITDGTTFRSSAIASVMTGPTFTQRILGVSRDAECLTNVFFAVTGNNIELGPDELTRWMVCRLAPSSARPHERTFRNPDLVGRTLRMRAQILRDALGIVAGYLTSGAPVATARGSRFLRWDRMVRRPLLWAGAHDVAEVFEANMSSSEELGATQGLLKALRAYFGDRPFYAVDVAQAARGPLFSEDLSTGNASAPNTETQRSLPSESLLVTSLETLRAKDATSSRSVGRVLRSVVDRPVCIEEAEGTFMARLEGLSKLNGVPRYRVAATKCV